MADKAGRVNIVQKFGGLKRSLGDLTGVPSRVSLRPLRLYQLASYSIGKTQIISAQKNQTVWEKTFACFFVFGVAGFQLWSNQLPPKLAPALLTGQPNGGLYGDIPEVNDQHSTLKMP